MAEIKPFRGIHYNALKVNLNKTTTPPYDVINTEQQEEYYRRDPHNFIRLDLGRIYDADDELDNRYARAAKDFNAWLESGVLVQDEKPALYVYRLSYDNDGKTEALTGLICLVKIEELGVNIKPHEKTLSGPKKDRAQLLAACQANFSQIFSLFSDRSGRIKSIYDQVVNGSPEQQMVDEQGVCHEVWRLEDAGDIDKISESLESLPLLIADGHHRYETALRYAEEARENKSVGKAARYTMMFLADMAHEGVTVLPTHRTIKAPALDLDALLTALERSFRVEEVFSPAAANPAGPEAPTEVVFGLYARGRSFRLVGSRPDLVASVGGSRSEAWKNLDTALLQELILEPLLRVKSGDSALKFTQALETAVGAVDRNQADLAFLLRPTPIEQIESVAEAGDLMPQKSTYFYPKPRTGLVVYKFS